MKYIKTFENLFDHFEKLPQDFRWKYVYAFNDGTEDENDDNIESVYTGVKVYGITEKDWNILCYKLKIDPEKISQLEAHLSGDQKSYDYANIIDEIAEIQVELLSKEVGKFLGRATVNIHEDNSHTSNFKPKITGHSCS